ncbi:FtsX-like permease family protein [Streptomyces sp. NPDC093795]|uniref:FtsX-like permease family protein n=1 Tax=Streptomyces sp. NPDC093795 TaxID=3366051 RepID=UPI0038234D17
MAALGLFTTVFVVASMLILSTGMRRREVGLLRTIGAAPSQIRRMILGEAAMLIAIAIAIAVAVGYSVIAVANSMAMAAHGRRRDYAVMKSAGGTVRQLLRLAACETAVLVAVGAGLGVLVTLPPLAGTASGLSQVTSSDVGLYLNNGAVLAAIIGTLLAAVLAGVMVTGKTLRQSA